MVGLGRPGDDPYVLTVGAIRDNTTNGRGDDTVPSFSGAGPTTANGLAKPDLAVPGGSVISSRDPGSYVDTAYPNARIGSAYSTGSGTSFSTAMTSWSTSPWAPIPPRTTGSTRCRML